MTNICARATRGQADLTKDEVTEGAGILRAKIEEFKPKIVVFNGKGIYEIFSGRKIEKLGLQSGSGMGVKVGLCDYLNLYILWKYIEIYKYIFEVYKYVIVLLFN